ncbi:MAG: single-stranded DNA-binding protein [Candidatus Melainabacteria bacterium]|nr:single-stranded DNA-binding protein [Candidatus Melainabacteria bacterium]
MNNNLNLIGHVGNEPEVRTFETGNKLVKFSLGVKDFSNRDNANKAEDATMWVTVESWNKVGERVLEQVTKGREISASGRLAINTFAKQVGQEKFDVSLPVLKLSGFHLCGAKPKTKKVAAAK